MDKFGRDKAEAEGELSGPRAEKAGRRLGKRRWHDNNNS